LDDLDLLKLRYGEYGYGYGGHGGFKPFFATA